MKITRIDPRDQHQTASWDAQAAILAARFRQKTRDEWNAIFEGTDSCAAPVLSLAEATQHAHSQARNTYVTVDGIEQPGPAPRFSRTQSVIRHGPTIPGDRDREVFSEWGLGEAEINRFTHTNYRKAEQ
jgi:alpha-methylacyl-CoA racemase